MKRFGLMIIFLFSFTFIQVTLINTIPYLDTAPNLLLILTFSVGILRGSTEGILTGFVAGLLSDMFVGQYLGFSSIPFMYIGYLAGFPYQRLTVDVPLVPLIASVISEFGYHFYIFIFRFVIRNRLNFGFYFKTIILPEMVLTSILSIILFGLLYYGNQYLEENEKRSALKFV